MSTEHTTNRKRPAGFKVLLLIGLALFGSLVGGNANAQIPVTDGAHIGLNQFSWGADFSEQLNQLQQLQQQYTKLQEQYQQMQKQYQQGFIGSFTDIGQAAGGPDIEPKKVDVNFGVNERCKISKTPVAALQYDICREIVRTSNAQFNYAVTMFETTEERSEQLQEIRQQRASLSQQDQGMLLDNTNNLLALQALMLIDAQQAETNMEAFEKRLRYLREQQDYYANQALNGGKDLLGGITSGIVLKAALETVKTNN